MAPELKRPPLLVVVARALAALVPAIAIQLAFDKWLRISPLGALLIGVVCGAGCFVWLSRRTV